MPRLLVTGSSGLIGSEMVAHFAALGWEVDGVDSNQRAVFFGPGGDTRWMQQRLSDTYPPFATTKSTCATVTESTRWYANASPDAIVHAAAQPSHDRAAAIPFDDFDTNAVGTLNLLEAARRHAPDAPFVHFSTNKVYGDAPNELRLNELETRWDYADAALRPRALPRISASTSRHTRCSARRSWRPTCWCRSTGATSA